MKYLWVVCLGLSGLMTGCGDPEDFLVAEVGPYKITATTLRTFVERLPEGLRTQKTGDPARREYLQNLIDRSLMLMEARAMGLDTTQAVQRAVRDAVDVRVRALYREREISPKAEVSEEMVRAVIEREGFDRERKLYAILVKTRDEIEEVVRKLEAGRPFEEVARTHSLDKRSANQGGELGFIDQYMASRLQIPPEVFRSLPLGEVSQPISTGKSWHVVRFTEERPAAFEKYQQLIKSHLIKEQTNQVEKEHLEWLGETFHLRSNQDGLQELIEAYRKETSAVLAASQTALYVCDEREITVAEAQEILQRMNLHRGLVDSARAVSILQKFVLNPFLIEEAAQRAGIYAEPEVRRLETREQEDRLLEIMKKIAVTQHIEISEEDERQFYDNRPELFYLEDSIWIEEVLLPTQGEAEQVKQQIAAGIPFAAFVDRSLRKGAGKEEGRFHFHPREKALYPTLILAIMAASEGELVGPLEVKGGYSVFSVLRREEASIEPFGMARRRVQALLLREREKKGLEALAKRLAEKYASQITIYESRLPKALPDSLVGI